MYEYRADFYNYLASFAIRSAARVVPILSGMLPIRSVVDFGCGHGAWLSAWQSAAVSITGVDGSYVDRRRLLIDPAHFHAADLAEPLSASRARQFVDTLTAHGSCVLFSAAVPGQGGEHHVNEQPLDYWRAMFRQKGFAAVDCLRPLIVGDAEIEPWYRYNIILYVAEDHLAALPETLRSRRVADADELDDYRPLPYRLRQALMRRLPVGAVSQLPRLRASLAVRNAGVRG